MRDVQTIGVEVAREHEALNRMRAEIGRVLVGQEVLVERLLMALLCNQHVLIEGIPGLAKTLAVTTLARCMHATYQRVQFTPDLLPADVIGTLIYNPKTGSFTTKKGPIFANLVLADEINRAPAKVQSALLEAMQERHVTLGDTTYPLDTPFLVLATQNPIEQEGTYPLPEAQVDRFLFKVIVTYPTKEEEREVLRRMARSDTGVEVAAVLQPEDVLRMRRLCDEIYMDEKLEDYILDLVEASRHPERFGMAIGKLIRYGASPRATIFLAMAGRAQAFLAGRGYVTPQDIKDVAPDILRHRIVITYEAEAEEVTAEDLIGMILETVPVP